MIKVWLNSGQFELCRREGEDRRFYSILTDRYGRRNTHELTSLQLLDFDILGASGEYVVSWWTGLRWTSQGEIGSPHGNVDVGTDVQVRTVGQEWPRVYLHLHEEDPPDQRYVLVVRSHPHLYLIMGWLYGRDGKKTVMTHYRYPCYGTVSDLLEPMESFRCPRNSRITRFQPKLVAQDDFL